MHGHGGGAHDDGDHAIQPLGIQFEDLDQQNESYLVGMWTFLVTEVMFFGALFLCYSVYRVMYPEVYLDAHVFLDPVLGGINTLVLLFSSVAMALAVHAAQRGWRIKLINWLGVVVICSFIFLGIKTVEYSKKFNERLFPGPTFDYAYAKSKHHGGGGDHGAGAATGHSATEPATAGPEIGERSGSVYAAPNAVRGIADTNSVFADARARRASSETRLNQHAQLFFSIYFAMTGLHAVHIIIGILVMSILAGLAFIRHPSVQDYMPTEMAGLYWHFVDLVWIFLFPLFYLIS